MDRFQRNFDSFFGTVFASREGTCVAEVSVLLPEMDGEQVISIGKPVGSVGTSVKADRRIQAATKVSTEYDSEGGVFLNKISTTIFNGLVKLKTSFERGPDGNISYPLLGLVTKYLSVLYDHDDVNALMTLSGDLRRNLSIKYLVDIKV